MLKRDALKGSNQVKITFVIPNDPELSRVSVVGNFNDWDPKANVFVKRQNNTRSVSTTLDVGQCYEFRYYTADGQWINDDSADAYEPNEHGSHNCILRT